MCIDKLKNKREKVLSAFCLLSLTTQLTTNAARSKDCEIPWRPQRSPGNGLHTYCRLLRYVWSDPSLMGSLMIISPLRILMLYRQDGFVQTQALYSMEAPWLPKSESGTRSPSLHLRHRGNAFSTKSSPSFSCEDSTRLPDQLN